jgi:hypothetical protein
MEKKDLKPGNLVVVGTPYGGNRVGTVTKVVSLLKDDKKFRKAFDYVDHNLIACEAVTSNRVGFRSHYCNSGLQDMGFKTPCWLESVEHIRMATKEERQQYYRELQAHLENVNC